MGATCSMAMGGPWPPFGSYPGAAYGVQPGACSGAYPCGYGGYSPYACAAGGAMAAEPCYSPYACAGMPMAAEPCVATWSPSGPSSAGSRRAGRRQLLAGAGLRDPRAATAAAEATA